MAVVKHLPPDGSGCTGCMRSDSFVTVTKSGSGVAAAAAEPARRCAWCARRLPEPSRTGRPRIYCRRSCRQRGFEARRRTEELTWGDDRIHEALARIDDLHVTLAGIGDLVDEMVRDIDEGVAWTDDVRGEHVRRLAALVTAGRQ